MLQDHYPHNHLHVYRVISDSPSYHIGEQVTYGILNKAGGCYYGSCGTVFFSQFFEEFSNRAFTGHNQLIAKAAEHLHEQNIIRGHIIHSMMGGSLDTANLVPLTQSANRQHSGYEKMILDFLRQFKRICARTRRSLYLGYDVTVKVDNQQYPKVLEVSAKLYTLDTDHFGNKSLNVFRALDNFKIQGTNLTLPLWGRINI